MNPATPATWMSTCERVYSKYARPVAHLRDRFRSQRFGLVFGEGVGRELGFPETGELLNRIARDCRIPFTVDIEDDPFRAARLLYEHFCATEHPDTEAGRGEHKESVRTRWLERVHRCLYGESPASPAVLEQRSPYLGQFLPLLRAIPFSINYNFDDTLERLLHLSASRGDGPLRRYVSLWGAARPPVEGGAVFHPDGFVPSRLRDDLPNREIVPGQAVLGEEVCGPVQGQGEILAAYLCEMTCLMVGAPFANPGLREALRRSAELYPGHVHYTVRLVYSPEDLSDGQRRSEVEANFARYNLVTLFLTAEEIAALAALVHDDTTLAAVTDKAGYPPRKFVYYLVGASGVGKTTALRHFYSLRPHEEWPEPLFPLMTKDFSGLSEEERRQVDDWVDTQWQRKNAAIARSGPGIDIVDRGPLDALAYVPLEAVSARAARALASIRSADLPVTPGHIIRLRGANQRVCVQAQRAFRSHGLAGTDWEQQTIGTTYEMDDEDPSTVTIDGLTSDGVARRIARIIYLEDYRPRQLDDRLVSLARS
jgi:hypothetical protein